MSHSPQLHICSVLDARSSIPFKKVFFNSATRNLSEPPQLFLPLSGHSAHGRFTVAPTRNRRGFKPGFAAIKASSLTPCFRAMDASVSPLRITYERRAGVDS